MTWEPKPCIKERYVSAAQSSNLMDDERHHKTDILQAMALSMGLQSVEINGQQMAAIGKMVGGLGGLLVRVKAGHDMGSYNTLMESWVDCVTSMADASHWPTEIKPRKVAISTLNYWLKNICSACHGRRFIAGDNPQVLSTQVCECCDGTGIEPIRCAPEIKKYANQAIEELSEIDRMIGIRAKKKEFG